MDYRKLIASHKGFLKGASKEPVCGCRIRDKVRGLYEFAQSFTWLTDCWLYSHDRQRRRPEIVCGIPSFDLVSEIKDEAGPGHRIILGRHPGSQQPKGVIQASCNGMVVRSKMDLLRQVKRATSRSHASA